MALIIHKNGACGMEFRQLEIFRILAGELNFTRTAERAHCVQSNVSVQIRSLEGELGVQLFERLGQKVKLTAHGEKLLPYADRILRLIEEAQAVAVGDGDHAGTLVVGSPESVLTYRLPRVIRMFRAKFPHVQLVFRSVGSTEIPAQLEHGEIDIGLVIDDSFTEPKCHVEGLCPEPVVLLVEPGHALLNRRKRIQADELSTQPFLLTDVGCAYRSKLERALAVSNVRPKAIMEFTSVETIKRCAELGMGIACLPEIVVHRELVTGRLAALPWNSSELAMKTLIAWHEDKWLSPSMKAFISLMRSSLGSTPAIGKRDFVDTRSISPLRENSRRTRLRGCS